MERAEFLVGFSQCRRTWYARLKSINFKNIMVWLFFSLRKKNLNFFSIIYSYTMGYLSLYGMKASRKTTLIFV